jgi:lipopolysaccharide/colanic/teichoic acid biosynthesis glycosyltransferase
MSGRPARAGLYKRAGKRVTDICLAGVALTVLAPVIGLVGLLVWVRDGRPVIYVQTRPGIQERPFSLLKFRTMHQAEPGVPTAPDALRLTRLGRVLRRWSLDELPQLLNVLRGDMSLVGPRPLLMRYLPHFSAQERRRFDVRPGMTGWAQVQGRNALDWDSRLALDAWYVDHCSLALDIRVLLVTIKRVLSGHGVHVDQSSVMPDFDQVRHAALRDPR